MPTRPTPYASMARPNMHSVKLAVVLDFSAEANRNVVRRRPELENSDSDCVR